MLSSILAVAAGAIPLVIDYLKSRQQSPPPAPHPHPHPHHQYPSRRRPPGAWPAPDGGFQPGARRGPGRRHGGATALVVGLVVLALIGGGAAYAVSWAIGQVTGNERVVAERLAEPVEGAAGPLSAISQSAQ